MYKTVLFDLDGTLLDTIADLCAAAQTVCRDFRWPQHSLAAIQAMVGNGMVKLVADFAPPGTSPEQLSRALERFQDHYARCCTDSTQPYPGIPALLERLRGAGVQLGVLSNKADAFTQSITAHYFPGVFGAVRGSLPSLPAKPGAAAALSLLRRLETPPQEALLVGDSDVDLRTGQNAGVSVCAVTWGFRSRSQLLEAGAACLADTPEQLEALIRSGGA